VASGARVGKGQQLLFSRLIPSFCDRQHYFELLIGGLAAQDGADTWLSETTRHSNQFSTKHYFDTQFQLMVENHASEEALLAISARASSALRMQFMMLELRAHTNLAQVYQWLQEKSLLSAGSLLFNPAPGMPMRACDLARNLFLSPWAGETLAEQEATHEQWWLRHVEIPCGGDPARIDAAFLALVDEFPLPKQCETEKKLLEAFRSPAFADSNLGGMLLYARILTLWEFLEDAQRGIVDDVIARQRRVSVDIMERIGDLLDATPAV